MTDTLFGVSEPPPQENLSAGRRLTLRQKRILAQGMHPLTLLPGAFLRLHPDAPPPDDRKAPGPRCGTCRFREPWGAHSFPKCLRAGEAHASHSAASDCRAWWPACEFWEKDDD